MDNARHGVATWRRLVGMDITLGYDAFSTGLADVRADAAELDRQVSLVSREVASLLDSGWRGAAAASFGEAWSDWLDGAAQVQAALASIVSALDVSQRSLASADTESSTASQRLLSRLAS